MSRGHATAGQGAGSNKHSVEGLRRDSGRCSRKRRGRRLPQHRVQEEEFMAEVDTPIVVVHLRENGDIECHLSGDVVVLYVDERFPHDRVYQMTEQTPREEIAALIGDSPVGSRQDVRHAAIKHHVERWLEGKNHLEIVDDDA